MNARDVIRQGEKEKRIISAYTNLYEKVGFQEIGIAPWGEMLAKYSFC
ncbi:hypothetical protein XYCOK13_35700 [Xylanibacillus composti]|uniref:Uncharacterized protein n=1 Tax=Xylanibacillus composti TaxID=1572762 RepID=A0A8J4M4K0_9BACL|nr:hypothetical protein XYCOK13_35700 [Xylanibacillus composti]